MPNQAGRFKKVMKSGHGGFRDAAALMVLADFTPRAIQHNAWTLQKPYADLT